MQDDDNSSSALTAYILISLLESGVPLTASLINNALHCLEKGMEDDGGTTYTAALSTYALTLLEHPKANNSMKSLMKRATRNNVRMMKLTRILNSSAKRTQVVLVDIDRYSLSVLISKSS